MFNAENLESERQVSQFIDVFFNMKRNQNSGIGRFKISYMNDVVPSGFRIPGVLG